MLSGVKCMKCIISVYECQVYHYYVVLSESENMIPEKNTQNRRRGFSKIISQWFTTVTVLESMLLQ